MTFQTEMKTGTIVTFAGGTEAGEARILFAAPQDGAWLVAVDRTPFHPLSPTWPDQPGDRGFMVLADGARVAVADSVTGLLDAAAGVLLLGEAAAQVPRDQPDTHAVVLHVVAGDMAGRPGEGVRLQVDAEFRRALSLQHSGIHLAALALNQCAAGFWTKDFSQRDALGFPDFDKAAVARSAIFEDRSEDAFRIGKSLRKKGFDRDAFMADLPARAGAVNATLRAMLAGAGPAGVTPAEGPLDGRRLWSTRLQGAEVAIFCGGTHVSDLSGIAEIAVSLEPGEDGFLMVTRSRAG